MGSARPLSDEEKFGYGCLAVVIFIAACVYGYLTRPSPPQGEPKEDRVFVLVQSAPKEQEDPYIQQIKLFTPSDPETGPSQCLDYKEHAKAMLEDGLKRSGYPVVQSATEADLIMEATPATLSATSAPAYTFGKHTTSDVQFTASVQFRLVIKDAQTRLIVAQDDSTSEVWYVYSAALHSPYWSNGWRATDSNFNYSRIGRAQNLAIPFSLRRTSVGSHVVDATPKHESLDFRYKRQDNPITAIVWVDESDALDKGQIKNYLIRLGYDLADISDADVVVESDWKREPYGKYSYTGMGPDSWPGSRFTLSLRLTDRKTRRLLLKVTCQGDSGSGGQDLTSAALVDLFRNLKEQGHEAKILETLNKYARL